MAKGSVLFLLAFVLLSIGRLAVERAGYQHILPLTVPFMWLSLSIGFIFTLYDMIQLYAIEVISECLQCRYGWRDLSLVKLFPFLIVNVSMTWAVYDMWLRWDKAYQNWAVHYQWYSQLTLDVAICLYFVFILVQGLYLSAVALRMDEEMAYKYIEKEGARQHYKNLLLINAICLVYNIIWAFTLIQKESITQIFHSYVLNFGTFGTFGLIAFHIVSVMVLWIFLANHSKPEATTGKMPIPDSPKKWFLFLFRLLYLGFFTLYVVLRIFLYFEVLETTYLLVLFLVYLVSGIIFIGFKIRLLWKFIVKRNVPVLTKNYEMKHWLWVIALILSMMTSLAVIVHLGKDRYDLWQPMQEAVLFQFFLSLYVVAHMLLVLFEGLVANGLLLFEDILPYHSEDSDQNVMRQIAGHVFMKSSEASIVFSIYSMVFVFGLPYSGLHTILVKLVCGPTFFHGLIAMAYYFEFQMGYLKKPEQQQHLEVQGVQGREGNLSAHSSRQEEPWHRAKSLVDQFPSRFLVLSCTCLFLLSFVRWLLVQETMGYQIPPQLQTFITYAVWLAYQGVCYYWLYAMAVYLSCCTVIKRSFCHIWLTVQECSVLNYPKSILFGICVKALVALAVVSEVLRCNLSTSKWAYHDWSVIVGYPLMAVHASALICQGLLLGGACIAPDTTRDTKEGENESWFRDSFGYLLAINIFLLVEHALFVFYTNIDILEPVAFGLIVYHAASCCIIVFLRHTQQETANPSDAASEDRNDCTGVANSIWRSMEHLLSPCFRVCHQIKSEPMKGTLWLIYIMIALSIARVLVKCLTIFNMYSTHFTIIFRFFACVTFGVANFNIWQFLIKRANHNQTRRTGLRSILVRIFLAVIVVLGVAEIVCTVIHQMTLSSMVLDISLLITAFMNVALVLNEGYAAYLLTIQKVRLGGSHSYNVSNRVIELIVTLNLFYAAFGVFSSVLDWYDKYSGSSMPDSIVSLLGHVTCSVLVPAMVIPVVESMWENGNLDIQTEDRGETPEQEAGSQESSGITSNPTECHLDIQTEDRGETPEQEAGSQESSGITSNPTEYHDD